MYAFNYLMKDMPNNTALNSLCTTDIELKITLNVDTVYEAPQLHTRHRCTQQESDANLISEPSDL